MTNYTNLLLKGILVCLLMLATQVVFAGATQAAVTCSEGTCWYAACSQNSDCGSNHFTGFQTCQGNEVWQNYISYTCNNPGAQNANCTSSIVPTKQTTCSSGQVCQTGMCQGSSTGTSTSTGSGNTTNTSTSTGTSTGTGTSSCTQNAYKQCVSNISYWHDSCGNIQSVYQNCNNTNQACSNGQCVAIPGSGTGTGYVAHSYKACYNKSVYWFNSNQYATDIYKNCSDNNTCTVDSCSAATCSNTLKCDGSTCVAGSADYQTHCSNTGTPTTGSSTTGQTQSVKQLMIALFAQKGDDSALQKTLTAANGESVRLVLIVKNSSTSPIENVSVSVNASGNINFANDITIDTFATSGSIASGVNLGTIAPNTSKAVAISGTVSTTTSQTFQVTSQVTSGSISDSDFVAMTVGTSTTGAAISESESSNAIWDFIKRWYIWMIILIVLVVLFVIIFRRLSDNNAA